MHAATEAMGAQRHHSGPTALTQRLQKAAAGWFGGCSSSQGLAEQRHPGRLAAAAPHLAMGLCLAALLQAGTSLRCLQAAYQRGGSMVELSLRPRPGVSLCSPSPCPGGRCPSQRHILGAEAAGGGSWCMFACQSSRRQECRRHTGYVPLTPWAATRSQRHRQKETWLLLKAHEQQAAKEKLHSSYLPQEIQT